MRAIYPHELLDSTGKEALKYLAQPNVVRILVSARAAFASSEAGPEVRCTELTPAYLQFFSPYWR